MQASEKYANFYTLNTKVSHLLHESSEMSTKKNLLNKI